MYVSFILDETGSMNSYKDQTISGFNEYIETLKKDDDAKKMRFTLTKFNSMIGAKIAYDSVKIKDVEKLDSHNYSPQATTPLYDAIGATIKSIGNKRKVLFIIQTDGLENASREFTQKDIFELIEKKKKKGWTFVFLGADQDAYVTSEGLGIARGNTMPYDSHNTEGTIRQATLMTIKYARSGGAQSSTLVEDLDKDEDSDNNS